MPDTAILLDKVSRTLFEHDVRSDDFSRFRAFKRLKSLLRVLPNCKVPTNLVLERVQIFLLYFLEFFHFLLLLCMYAHFMVFQHVFGIPTV